MHNLLDLTNSRRVLLADLTFDTSDQIACVIVGDDIVQLTPPCDSTSGLAFLFLNGRECARFILLGEYDGEFEWLADDGRILTNDQLADLPLITAASNTPLTLDLLRRFDS
jgi:hypothetical protein